ncbi:MAG: riboflavin biosynthesis protein RibF [Sphingopyxis sp.]|nr:riboflavin biosynthesis protein RibF [Sphingopyxis sp.]
MKLHRRIQSVGEPLALAIGNFDGVHLGHQAILERARNAASRLEFQPAALTFVPLPREYFATLQGQLNAPPRLMSVTEKCAAFHRHGMAHVFMQPFNAAFAALSPAAFFQQLLDANVRWLIVGQDFRFGEKRAGDVALLRTYAAAHGITVETMPDIANADGSRISSTSIREALSVGALDRARAMLGQRYAITGRVTHGKKLGRRLGFPTANVSLTGRKPPLHGVFAVQCCLVTRGLEGVAGRIENTENAGKCDIVLNGVANLGSNPVVSIDNRLHLEVFLFDHVGDIYGKRLKVTFIEKIRELHLLREVIRVASVTVENCYDYQGGLEEFIDKVEQDIFRVTQDRVSDGARPMKGPTNEAMAVITKMMMKRASSPASPPASATSMGTGVWTSPPSPRTSPSPRR